MHSARSVPPATQKPCTLHTTGLSEWNRRHEAAHVARSSSGSRPSDPTARADRGCALTTAGIERRARAARRGAPRRRPCARRCRRDRSRRRSPCRCRTSAITCTAGSRFARSTHAASSRGISSVMPLPRAGRSSVMRATRPSTSYVMVVSAAVIGALRLGRPFDFPWPPPARLAVAPAARTLVLARRRRPERLARLAIEAALAARRLRQRRRRRHVLDERRSILRRGTDTFSMRTLTGSPSANCRPVRAPDEPLRLLVVARSDRRRARPSLTSPSTNGDSICTNRPKRDHGRDGAVVLLADVVAHQHRAIEIDDVALGLHRAPLGLRRLGRHRLQRLARRRACPAGRRRAARRSAATSSSSRCTMRSG